MSYTIATLMNVSTARAGTPVTKLTNGMKVLVRLDKQNGDDDDRVFETIATIANLRTASSGRFVQFDIAEYKTDEPIEVSASLFVSLTPAL